VWGYGRVKGVRDIATKISGAERCRPELPTVRSLFSNEPDRKKANSPLETAAVLALLELLGLLPGCRGLAR
jgi:hypothetical protein